jgi:hypothetical protein
LAKQKKITQAVAATQPDFHVHAAADYFGDSMDRKRGVKSRDLSRKRFLENVRLALPILGLDQFLTDFQRAMRDSGHEIVYDEAEPVIRQLAAEPAMAQLSAAVMVPPTADQFADKFTMARQLLAAAIRLLEKEGT